MMEEEVVDHKDTVVHEVEVPTTEQVDAPTEQQEQPDIVQGVPTHSIAEHIPLTPTVEDTSPNAPNVKYLFCKFCPYKTRFVGNLTKHVRTHTGEKPFACRHCGKRFASRSNLNYHEATHTGNKRFQCFISGCQFKTQLRESLNSHMRKIHGVLVSGDSPLPPGTDTLAAPGGSAGSVGVPAGLPMFSPGSMGSLPNLPPIQDILTAPTSLASMSLPQNTQVNLNDVKPSVAELAQYMIALHEGQAPPFKTESGGGPKTPRISAQGTLIPPPIMPEHLAHHKPGAGGDAPFTETSPEMGTMETDNDSGAGSPRGAAGVSRMLSVQSSDGGATLPVTKATASSWDPAMVAPRLPPPTMHAAVKAGGVVGVAGGPHTPILAAQAGGGVANMVDPKSSSLSNELLKIFSNLGLDTPAILDLLAAQGKLHICRSCNIVFPEYSTFVLHRGCHGNEGPFQCHFCQLRFPEKFGFLTHFMQCPHK